jgi:hypothetical protein
MTTTAWKTDRQLWSFRRSTILVFFDPGGYSSLRITRFLRVSNLFSRGHLIPLKVLKNEENLPWTTWVGAAGMPGQTAWYGLEKISKPVAGETMFVSGAAGAVGQ